MHGQPEDIGLRCFLTAEWPQDLFFMADEVLTGRLKLSPRDLTWGLGVGSVTGVVARMTVCQIGGKQPL